MAEKYYDLYRGGKMLGRGTASEFKAAAASGKIRPDDVVRNAGAASGVAAEKMKGLRFPSGASSASDSSQPAASTARGDGEHIAEEALRKTISSGPDLMAVAVSFRRLMIGLVLLMGFPFVAVVALRIFPTTPMSELFSNVLLGIVIVGNAVFCVLFFLWARAMKWSLVGQVISFAALFVPGLFLVPLWIANSRTKKILPSVRFGFLGPDIDSVSRLVSEAREASGGGDNDRDQRGEEKEEEHGRSPVLQFSGVVGVVVLAMLIAAVGWFGLFGDSGDSWIVGNWVQDRTEIDGADRAVEANGLDEVQMLIEFSADGSGRFGGRYLNVSNWGPYNDKLWNLEGDVLTSFNGDGVPDQVAVERTWGGWCMVRPAIPGTGIMARIYFKRP